jgi:hypothetical protein
LREDCSVAPRDRRAHAPSSVERFMLLRNDHGLPLRRVKQTIVEISRTLLTP